MSESRRPDRRFVYCLLCKQAFDNLAKHLKRGCMKNSSEAERDKALDEAKKSQREWTKVGRRWEHTEIASLVKNHEDRRALIDCLKSKGFFVVNDQQER